MAVQNSSIGLDILNSMGATTFNVKNMAKVLANADVSSLKANLATKQALHDDQLSGFDLLNRAFNGFKSQVSALASQSTFNKMSASSSDPTVLSATISGTAQAGSYSVEVQQLAKAHTLASTNAFASMTTAVGQGNLTINVGGVAHTLTIGPSNDTVAGIQDAINKAGIGVMATAVNTGNGYKLMMTSEKTGAANTINISVTNDADANNTDNAGLSQLVTANMQQTVPAQDATVVVNGLTVNSATNKMTGVIPGVDLNLLSAKVGQTNRIDVARDTSNIGQKVKDFVDLYNSMEGIFKSVTAYSKDTSNTQNPDKTKGTLPGSSIVRMMKEQIRNVMQTHITGLTGPIQSMADIGISSQLDGTLKLDSVALDKALAADPVAIGKLFSATGTTTDSFVKVTGSNDKTLEGSYTLNIKTAAAQASFTGIATGHLNAFTITAGVNDTLTLNLDGHLSATLTLAAGTYTGAQLAKEIDKVVNNDTNLTASGGSISTAYNAGADTFTFTSQKYGSASTINFTGGSVLGSLGVASGNNAAGVDVGGQLTNSVTGDVYTFTGVGQHVTVSDYAGANLPKGLQFDVQGNTTGARGTIDFNRGYADKLSQLFSTFQGTDGLLGQQLDKLNKETTDLADQQKAIDAKYAKIEMKYKLQFGALQSVLSGMKQTQASLAATFNQKTTN